MRDESKPFVPKPHVIPTSRASTNPDHQLVLCRGVRPTDPVRRSATDAPTWEEAAAERPQQLKRRAAG